MIIAKLRLCILLLVVSLLIGFSQPVMAQQATDSGAIAIKKESVNPDLPGEYQFKRLKEKIGLFFRFSKESKASYLRELLHTRLAELKYIVEENEMGEFEHATTRYSTQAGDLTTLIVSGNLKDQVRKTIEEMDLGIKVIQQLQKKYPDEGMAQWRFMEDDINYLKIYKEALSNL